MDSKARTLNALLIIVLLLASSGGSASAQTPVGSAFTYQGRLLDSLGAPIAGLCDIDFSLYDEGSGGSQVGATVTITNVVMTDGYFSVSLDFGSPAWNGDARWLQVTPTCPPGGAPEVMPRQAVETVPYAVYALNGTVGTTSTVYITNTVYITESFYYTPSYHLQGWDTITGTPGTYTPTSHTQDWNTITGNPAGITVSHATDYPYFAGRRSRSGPVNVQENDVLAEFGGSGYNSSSGFSSTPDGSMRVVANETYDDWIRRGTRLEFWVMQSTEPSSIERMATINYTGLNVSSGKFIDALTNGSTGGIRAGASSDALLYRDTADVWRTPDALTVDGVITASNGVNVASGQFVNALTDGSTGGIRVGASSDVLLYRSLTDTLRTPDTVIIDPALIIAGTTLEASSIQLQVEQVAGQPAIAQIVSNAAAGARVWDTLVGATTLTYRAVDDAYAHAGNYMVVTRNAGSYTIASVGFPSGNVGIGVTAPSDFKLQTAGSIGPDAANTYDLGSASKYWATIHYKTLTSHSLAVFSTTVRLQDGRNVSCLDALEQIRAEPDRLTKGNLPHMDYSTIPALAVNSAPFAYNGATLEKKGEDGADLDMMVSLVLCAERELDAKNDSLNQKLEDLDARLAALELRVK